MTLNNQLRGHNFLLAHHCEVTYVGKEYTTRRSSHVRHSRGMSTSYASSLPRATISKVNKVSGIQKMNVTTLQNVVPVAGARIPVKFEFAKIQIAHAIQFPSDWMSSAQGLENRVRQRPVRIDGRLDSSVGGINIVNGQTGFGRTLIRCGPDGRIAAKFLSEKKLG